MPSADFITAAAALQIQGIESLQRIGEKFILSGVYMV
jgi:hypothetical protein